MRRFALLGVLLLAVASTLPARAADPATAPSPRFVQVGDTLVVNLNLVQDVEYLTTSDSISITFHFASGNTTQLTFMRSEEQKAKTIWQKLLADMVGTGR